MNVVLSPSNMKVFRDCPRKFQAQYVTKELHYSQSPAAARGEQLHTLMENAVNSGWDSITWPEPGNLEYARGFIQAVTDLKAAGWSVRAELEAATDGRGNVTGWWDKPPQNFMRSKIDVCATHSDKDHAIIIDWKSGKPWDDELQLYTNALCLYPMTGLTKYQVMFAYLDSGIVKNYELELDVTRPLDVLETNKIQSDSKVLFLFKIMQDMRESFEHNEWPATRNRFCNWCDLKTCEYK